MIVAAMIFNDLIHARLQSEEEMVNLLCRILSMSFLDSGNIVCGNPKCFKAVLQVTRPLLG